MGFHDPVADGAFVSELKANLPDNVTIIERDTHIEDPAFATECAQRLISLIAKQQER
jgi:uncharacterized protein (UPF0261 family)